MGFQNNFPNLSLNQRYLWDLKNNQFTLERTRVNQAGVQGSFRSILQEYSELYLLPILRYRFGRRSGSGSFFEAMGKPAHGETGNVKKLFIYDCQQFVDQSIQKEENCV